MLTLNKKIVRILTLFIILLILLTNKNYAIVGKSYDFYVNDTANILNNETEKYIIDTNIDLESKTGAQIVVVTVKSLENMSVEDYANKLFRSYRNWRQQ